MKTNAGEKNKLLLFLGIVLSGILASLCCIGPLLLVSLGLSGAWIGNLSTLAPYRPIFIVFSLLLLVFAFWDTYRMKGGESCMPGSICANPGGNKMRKLLVWILALVTLTLLALPFFALHVFAAEKKSEIKEVVLIVSKMTCEACPVTVKKAIMRLDGIKEVAVTLKPPEAHVKYDSSKLSPKDIIKATTDVGYPSSEKKEKE